MEELGLGLRFEGGEGRRDERKKKWLERRHYRSGNRRRARGEGPDSPIRYSSHHHSISSDNAFLGGSSLFTSTPGSSVDNFGSDPESVYPQSFTNLAGRGQSSVPGHFPSPNNITVTWEGKVQAEEEGKEEEEEEQLEETLNPEGHSISYALTECWNPMFKSEALPLPSRISLRQRTASLDLNGKEAGALSPPFFVRGIGDMKKNSVISTRLRSPGTPNYQKGWSSERVPLPSNCRRRYGASSALYPFSNGRTLPSKWEDAEKWICSPVSGDGTGRPLVMPYYHRRPKAKSGPLGAPASVVGSYLAASPLVPCFDSGRVVNVTANSPFLAGVLVTDRQCCGNGNSVKGGGGREGVGIGGRFYSANMEIVQSANLHGWLDKLIEPSSSLPSLQGILQDEKVDNSKEATVMISAKVLQKDMATQMSPGGSTHSSPEEKPSLSSSPASAHPIAEVDAHLSKLEVRDVQVDDQVSVTAWSRNHTAWGSDRCLANIIEWKKRTVESRASAWEVAETSKRLSKYNREEARITAWENLQKAKAEAAIHKLEMKLDKKRSSSMEKILSNLRSAQRKAQEMRNAVAANGVHQDARTTRRALFFGRSGQMRSLSSCFTCHAS